MKQWWSRRCYVEANRGSQTNNFQESHNQTADMRPLGVVKGCIKTEKLQNCDIKRELNTDSVQNRIHENRRTPVHKTGATRLTPKIEIVNLIVLT